MRFLRLLTVVPLLLSYGFASAQETARSVEVFVALADNKHQAIVPVPEKIGNGDDPANNLYWGAMYGLKNMLGQDKNWKLIKCEKPQAGPILETCRYKRVSLTMQAHAYRGREIETAISDFLDTTVGRRRGAKPRLAVYVGHNGLMDFAPPPKPAKVNGSPPRVIILACAAKPYFGPWLRAAGAKPLVWTTGLMAPEAYTLLAALDGWAKDENDEAIRLRAAKSYAKYQKIKLKAAKWLLVSGW